MARHDRVRNEHKFAQRNDLGDNHFDSNGDCNCCCDACANVEGYCVCRGCKKIACPDHKRTTA